MKTEKTIWQKSREELFQELSSTPEGLTGAEAARRLEEYQARAQRLGKEYEEKFGPLGETTQDTSRWAWISDPWPWEKEGN